MYIPEKLKVKTATHRIINNVPIAFITYKDEHGKVRSETSWKKWGKIELPDIDNAPLSGYKIFDDVTRRSSYFGSGRTMLNVCHPNGFFFEISSDNLAELVCNCEIKKALFKVTVFWLGIKHLSPFYQRLQMNIKKTLSIPKWLMMEL